MSYKKTDGEIRADVLEEIGRERDYQQSLWGNKFDNKNTVNDWVAYINSYASQAIGTPNNPGDAQHRRTKLLKAAAIACAAVETIDRQGDTAPRHYDVTS